MMKMIPLAILAITAGLFLVPAAAQQATPKAPEHSVPTPQSGGTMNHAQMISDMQAVDARLEALAQTMKSANGNDKVRVMEELVTELVKSQADMHKHMSMMHDHMMSQTPHK